jgi:hypothetical protein
VQQVLERLEPRLRGNDGRRRFRTADECIKIRNP